MAVLIGTSMILSVYMSHGGYDEENLFTDLETVKIIMEEGKKMAAKDFIGRELTVELKLEGGLYSF